MKARMLMLPFKWAHELERREQKKRNGSWMYGSIGSIGGGCPLVWRCETDPHPAVQKISYKDYVSLVASFASLFAATVFILEYCHIQQSDKTQRMLPFADDSRDYWNLLEHRFADPDLYPLYSQIHSNHPDLARCVDTQDHKLIKEIQAVSSMLIQIESLLILHGGLQTMRSEGFSHPRKQQQIRVWKRWFQSSIVQSHYTYLKENLGPDTQVFISEFLYNQTLDPVMEAGGKTNPVWLTS